ncbi:hypothetical protein F5Y17DRAFT_462186 [Xylariaceae sp. FL0594]|nr:hypothetical protein F5Y17DRAFT_462186 [Xylariaceae sp. FL0594]
MSGPVPPEKPYLVQLAERIDNTTGKEHLPTICVGGFALETLWHSVVERKVLKTPPPAVKKAIFRAAVMWPTVFVVTSASISWAAWRVDREGRDEIQSVQDDDDQTNPAIQSL